jgi:uncharacterized protein
MMPQAEALYYLQQIDLQILRNGKRLDEIVVALGDDRVVTQAREQVEAAQKMLSPLKTRMRDLELEIQSNTQKATATEDRLYSGSVKNPKELQDLQQEAAALKRWNDELEDRLLEKMLEVETAQAELDESEAALAQVTADWEREHADLLAEQAALEDEVRSLQVQREKALKNVTAESLKVYDTMRPKKANQPISPLRGRSCGVCGIEQTMAIESEVRRGEGFVPCTNCGRLLADVRG